MKLELSIMAGAESKAFLADLSKLVARMEAASGNGKDVKGNEDRDEETSQETASDDEDEDFAPPKKTAKASKAKSFEDDEDEAEETESDDDEEDAKPVKAAKKSKAKSFEDDEDESESEDAGESEDEEEEAKPAKKAKVKKPTLEEVNAACSERIKKRGHSFSDVKALLKKKFKVTTVTDLEEDQYADVIKVMKGK